MPTAKGFDPLAEPDQWPSYISAILKAKDTDWFRDAKCRGGGSYEPDYWTCTDGAEARRKRELAELECQICPVQWQCVLFAIDTGDKWNLCAIRPDEREDLIRHKGWRDLVKMAHRHRPHPISVHDLVERLRRVK